MVKMEIIKGDLRYKITQKDVDKMRQLRADGLSYASIGKHFNVSYSTAQYWCNDASRKKQRLKNAKRRHSTEEKIMNVKRQTERRKRLFKENPKWLTHYRIQSAKDEKRANRKTITNRYTGEIINMEEALEIYDSKSYCLTNAKIN